MSYWIWVFNLVLYVSYVEFVFFWIFNLSMFCFVGFNFYWSSFDFLFIRQFVFLLIEFVFCVCFSVGILRFLFQIFRFLKFCDYINLIVGSRGIIVFCTLFCVFISWCLNFFLVFKVYFIFFFFVIGSLGLVKCLDLVVYVWYIYGGDVGYLCIYRFGSCYLFFSVNNFLKYKFDFFCIFLFYVVLEDGMFVWVIFYILLIIAVYLFFYFKLSYLIIF